MRILVLTDLEGISGVCIFEQTRERGNLYEEARRLLMGDISAVVEGCLAGGAAEVVVEDGHGGGFNMVPELMHPGARYITGVARPRFPERAAFHQGYDAAILLGYHAMAGTPDGMLRHTQSSKAGNRYWYNGRESGEMAQSGLILGHYGTPVIMVSGDTACCREARAFFGEGPVAVAVKEGFGEQFGLLLPPEAAHEAIRQGAIEALRRVQTCQPYTIALPIQGRLRFPNKSTADEYRPALSKRVDDYTFEAVFESPLDIYSF
ncbi:MAG: peptidase M55 [Chloroflexi bacterium]|nr:peptidase M55 [Chloroflexota bacterium]